jgi:drug/metabolite transporter (DMT)-like permease
MIIAGTLLLCYQYVRGESIVLKRAYIWPLTVLTIFNVYLTNVLEFWGLQYLTSAKACFLYNLSPFVAALFSYFMFKERMTLLKCLALVIGFLGFIPILITDSAPESSVGGIGFISWPELALLGAAIATVYGWIAMKQLVKLHYSAISANGISMLAGGILSLITSFFFEAWCPYPVTSWSQFFIWIGLLTLVSNIICYNLYGYLLKKHSATFMTFVGFSSPFFTAFFGWLWLNETVTWHFYFSAAIVFTALYLYYYEELKEDGHIK